MAGREKNRRHETRRVDVDDTAVSVALSPGSGLDIIEAADLTMSGMRLQVAAPHPPESLEAGSAGGIEFFIYVGQVQVLGGRGANLPGNLELSVGFALGADAGVEIAAEQRREIAVIGMTEQQALRLHGARRIDVELRTLAVPLLELARRVLVQMTGEGAAAIAVFPDHALQHLERRDFLVFRHPL